MAQREITERQRSWLAEELRCWGALGLVSDEQSGRILELYGSAEEAAERRGARAVFTLMSLAALLVGLALLLLIGYNWAALPAAAKLALIFAVLLGTHGLAYFLRYRLHRPQASEVALFLACLVYGAAIWLVAQIYNINAGDADGFWWWVLGVLPFALGTGSLLLHILVVALLALYAGFATFGSVMLGGGLWRLLGLPASGAYSVPLLALPGLVQAYRRNSPRIVALYAPIVAWWVILQPFAWRLEANPVYFVGLVGGLFLLVAECHRPGSPLAIPYRFYGALLVIGALVPLSYHDFQREIRLYEGTRGMLAETAFAVALSLGLALLAAERDRRAAAGARPVPLAVALLGEDRRRWLPLGVVAFLTFLVYWNLLGGGPLLPTILANAVIVFLAFWLMQLGLREDRGRPFSCGVLLFLLWVVLRYIDLFGNFGGMLGASLMFFLCGAALFGVAQFWRQRKVARHGHA